jgi:2-dehydropantoate 2-reductase
MEETVRVAAATGIALDVDVEERIVYASRLANVKTSMLQDLEARRPLELDPIVGAIDELAGDFGVDAPTIRTVYALTKALERSYLQS